MPPALPFAIAALALASPAPAPPAPATPDPEAAFAAALRGCETWILQPGSWTNGVERFVAAVGLGDGLERAESVPEAALPPPQMRQGNHYWRIGSTKGAAYTLVVSDRLPICHITGGGADADLQPAVQSVLAASAFTVRWESLGETAQGDKLTSLYRHRDEPALSITITRASTPGQRRDRVQVIATGVWKPGE